jgi:hypothetical protein
LKDYSIQFERNVSYFSIGNQTIKKEIDISVFNEDKSERYAIELKFPRNQQYPAQMFSFVEDIKFMEELKVQGFTKTAAVVLVADKLFYQGTKIDGIYKYFRKEYSVYGKIFYPITSKVNNKDSITLNGKYDFVWKDLGNGYKYYVIEI